MADYNLVEVSDLDALENPSNSDVLPIQDGSGLKKITYQNLKTKVVSDEATARQNADALKLNKPTGGNGTPGQMLLTNGDGTTQWASPDDTLATTGKAADAKATGDAIKAVDANLAAPYSTSATYAVGDYCTKDGVLKRCNTAITTAEAWNSAHWDDAKLGGDVSTLRSAFNSFESEVDDTLSSRTVLTLDDALLKIKKVTNNYQPTEDANGTRIRIVFNCRNVPATVAVACSYGSFYVGEWDTINNAIASDVAVGLIKSITGGYTTSAIEGTVEATGFLCVSIKKDDGTAFSDADKAAALAATTIKITYESVNNAVDIINENISAIENNDKKLYIGNLVNGHLQAAKTDTTAAYAPYRLSTDEVVAFPTNVRKFKVKLADSYLVAMRTGAKADNLDTNLYWYKDGDIITVPEGNNYYGISVTRDYFPTSYNDIPLTSYDIDKMGLELLYDAFEDSGNSEAEKIISASRLTFHSTNPNNLTTIPVIAHTSDCHGDYQRVKRFLDFCDKIGVDAACITGDIVAYTPSQGLNWFSGLINNAKSLCGVCIGNHDVYDNSMTDANAYDFVFDNIADSIGNTTGKTYYYKDITDKKLRLISINLYEYGGTTRNKTHFSETQLSWLCSTLLSTPNDYGIILLYHSPQRSIFASATYDTFWQSTRKYNDIYSGVTGSPINDIIDAFIGRTTISQTYTQTGEPASVSVSADFTSVDSSIEFIAHLTGHFHQDSVCYVPDTTEKQLMLNVVCTNSLYGGAVYPYLCDLTDLPRSTGDATQDSFNVYAIDRANKVVKIIRIGSDMTYEMDEREYMEIPYAD